LKRADPIPRLLTDLIVLITVVSFMLFMSSCRQRDESGNTSGDTLLAEVFNKKLMLSEVEYFIPASITAADSSQIVRAYIDRWVREMLLLTEAEKKLPPDLEIDQLVKSYRSSLIISNYEKLLVEEQLDTLISEDEINEYYEANKQQYQLDHTILKCRLLKLKTDITPRDKDFVDKNWRSTNRKDRQYLERVCREFGEVCYLDGNEWLRFDHIKSLMPAGIISETQVSKNQEITYRDNQYLFYLRIFDKVSGQELAPLSFIEEQAKKFILHQRKLKLLEKIKESLYEKEILNKDVKIYVN
jgi:hypothetical protein